MKIKTVFLTYFTALFLFLSCTKSEEIQTQEIPLFDTWQLIEVYETFSESPDGNWYPVEDGHFYTFYENGTMSSNRFNCSNGVYEIETNENMEQRKITITFNCNSNQHQGTLRMPFIEEYLILIDEISCDEGCAEKYIKISNE